MGARENETPGGRRDCGQHPGASSCLISTGPPSADSPPPHTPETGHQRGPGSPRGHSPGDRVAGQGHGDPRGRGEGCGDGGLGPDTGASESECGSPCVPAHPRQEGRSAGPPSPLRVARLPSGPAGASCVAHDWSPRAGIAIQHHPGRPRAGLGPGSLTGSRGHLLALSSLPPSPTVHPSLLTLGADTLRSVLVVSLWLLSVPLPGSFSFLAWVSDWAGAEGLTSWPGATLSTASGAETLRGPGWAPSARKCSEATGSALGGAAWWAGLIWPRCGVRPRPLALNAVWPPLF